MKRVVAYVEAEHDHTAVTLENENGEESLAMPKAGACAVYWTDDPDYDVNKELGFFDYGTPLRTVTCSVDKESSQYKIKDWLHLSKWVLEPFEVEDDFDPQKLVFPVRTVKGLNQDSGRSYEVDVVVIDRVTYDGKPLKVVNWIAHGSESEPADCISFDNKEIARIVEEDMKGSCDDLLSI